MNEITPRTAQSPMHDVRDDVPSHALPSPAHGDLLPYDDPRFLSGLYRRELGEDLEFVATFLRHPSAARRGGGASHSVAVPGLPGVEATFRAHRAPVPRPLVDQLALRHPEYLLADGPVYASCLTIRLTAMGGSALPDTTTAATVCRALAEAMHPRRAAADIHDAGPAAGAAAGAVFPGVPAGEAAPSAGRRFRWIHDSAGMVLPTPDELFAAAA
ncbi:hypothetical protein [Corynebacterium sp.]|uniref:hypothetical protein n=1 Tax=Corynebacterium sp. TaxID=1720 RepID=UPI0026DC6FF3|nr:hypothetical protein [Corynebacterium sp.]MDO4610312.1 hypothetical protein [Corynebacterium sp.]